MTRLLVQGCPRCKQAPNGHVSGAVSSPCWYCEGKGRLTFQQADGDPVARRVVISYDG